MFSILKYITRFKIFLLCFSISLDPISTLEAIVRIYSASLIDYYVGLCAKAIPKLYQSHSALCPKLSPSQSYSRHVFNLKKVINFIRNSTNTHTESHVLNLNSFIYRVVCARRT